MAEETLEQRLAKLYAKKDHIDQFNEEDVRTLVDAIRDAREHGGTASVDITPLSGGGGYTITIKDSEGTEHTATVKDGGDAYEVYKSTVPGGQTQMSKDAWLASLKGADGADGQDGATPTINQTTKHWEINGSDTGVLAEGHNPNRGTYNVADAIPSDGIAGDYIVVVDDTQSTTTAEIRKWDATLNSGAGGWAQTGLAPNDAAFEDGQLLPNTKIDNTQLANPASNALAKAEDVLRINGTVIREVEAQVENRDWRPQGETMGGYWLTNNTWARSANYFKSALVSIPSGTIQIRFNTIIKADEGTSLYGFAFLDDTEELLGDVIPIPTVVGGTSPMDYTVRVPEGAAFMVSTCKTKNWSGENAYWYLQYRENILDIIGKTVLESVQYGLPIQDATKAVPSYDFVKTLIDASYDVTTLTNISSRRRLRLSIQTTGKYGTAGNHAFIHIVDAEFIYLNTADWLYVAFVSGSNPTSGGDLLLVGENVKAIGKGERYLKVPEGANLMLMFNSNGVYPSEIKIFCKRENEKQPIKKIVRYNGYYGTTQSDSSVGFITKLEANVRYNIFFRNSGNGTKHIRFYNDTLDEELLDQITTSATTKRIEITPLQSGYINVYKSSSGLDINDYATVEEVLNDLDFKSEVNDFRAKAVQEASLSGLTIVNGQALQEDILLKRAKQFTDIVWTPKSTFYGKTRDKVYTKDVLQTNGIPYSNNFTDYKFIGQTVSIHTFMTAINNPYSMIYTERVKGGDYESAWGRTYYGPNGYAYYGAVCCSFTSWCHGFKGYMGNPGYIWFSSYFGLTKAYDIRGKFDVNLLRAGDVLNSWEHAAIITGITRGGNGEVTTIHLAECGGNVGNVGGCHVFSNTPEKFKSKMRTTETDPMAIMRLFRVNDFYRNTKYTPSPYVVLNGETAQEVVYNDDICTVYGDKASLAEGYRVVLNYDLDGNHGGWTAVQVYKDDVLFGTYPISEIDQSALPEGQRGHALDLGDELTAGMYKARMTDGTDYSDYTYWEIVSNDVVVEALGEGKYRITNNTGKEMIDCVIGIYRTGDDLGMERADLSYPIKLEDIQTNQFTMNLRAWLQATNKSVALPYVIKLVVQGEYTGVATAVIQLPDINYQ